VCLSVCPRAYLPYHTRAIFTKFFVHVAYGRGSVLLRWDHRVTQFQGEGTISVFFIDNALCGRNSGMNFDPKDQFGLNLLFTETISN